MKIDIKNIIIAILILLSSFFIWKWYNSNNSEYKKELDILKEENIKIQLKRDSLINQRKNLESELQLIKKTNDSLVCLSNSIQKELSEQKRRANLSTMELDKLRKLLQETKLKIEELKRKPANRDGNDLLSSLKYKSQK